MRQRSSLEYAEVPVFSPYSRLYFPNMVTPMYLSHPTFFLQCDWYSFHKEMGSIFPSCPQICVGAYVCPSQWMECATWLARSLEEYNFQPALFFSWDICPWTSVTCWRGSQGHMGRPHVVSWPISLAKPLTYRQNQYQTYKWECLQMILVPNLWIFQVTPHPRHHRAKMK